jgi:ketosteroid isomerase-like protein
MELSELSEQEREVYDVSARWTAAIVGNDAGAIGSFMADEWIMVSERGVNTKEHFLSFVRSGQLTHSAMEMAEVGKISIFGDTAVLASRVTSTAHFGGQKFDQNEWTSDVFIKQDGEWKCVITHITPAAV